MKTLSIHKDKTSLASETVGKWWNSKNVFFSLLTEENFSNREVCACSSHSYSTHNMCCSSRGFSSCFISFHYWAAGGTCCIP